MALIRRDPWMTMPTLQNRINRLFDDMLPATEIDEMGFFNWQPSVDTYEKDKAIKIRAELPGVKKDDISIDVRNNVLTLSGERKQDEDVNEENFYRRERFYGRFQRAFTLPDDVDADNIDAHFDGGVLKITVPKTEESQKKQINVH
ncbi:MAG: Hsp20/alpha crystallin family protein [Desulfobacterales bacterium]|nr:Hsp20/alpha crystallin family protein [Desulfobacterales bacterium]